MTTTKKTTKPPSKKQQRRDEQARALIEFAETGGKPFVDLQPRRGESAMMRDFLNVSAILRRLEIAEVALMVPPHGPERRVFNRLKAKMVEECFWLRNATSRERVTRMIKTHTLP
jgi:hypothetical protein